MLRGVKSGVKPLEGKGALARGLRRNKAAAWVEHQPGGHTKGTAGWRTGSGMYAIKDNCVDTGHMVDEDCRRATLEQHTDPRDA